MQILIRLRMLFRHFRGEIAHLGVVGFFLRELAGLNFHHRFIAASIMNDTALPDTDESFAVAVSGGWVAGFADGRGGMSALR